VRENPDPAPGRVDDGAYSSGKHRIGAGAGLNSSIAPGSAGRFSVLVVDDDPAVLSSVEAILSFDFDVVSCSSPLDALRQFDARRFHVVCADYVMPTMDGRTLLSEIVRRSDTVCCLLMTARVDLESSDRDFQVVFKPFDSERFVRTVGQLARIAEMKRSTRAMSEAASTVPARCGKP
jgi:DNA-binding NtrC family response regulator